MAVKSNVTSYKDSRGCPRKRLLFAGSIRGFENPSRVSEFDLQIFPRVFPDDYDPTRSETASCNETYDGGRKRTFRPSAPGVVKSGENAARDLLFVSGGGEIMAVARKSHP